MKLHACSSITGPLTKMATAFSYIRVFFTEIIKRKFACFLVISCVCVLSMYNWRVQVSEHFFRFYYVFIKNQDKNASLYVSFDVEVADGRRLGNQIFDLAAVLYISVLTGKKPVLDTRFHLPIEDVFELSLDRADNICPCYKLVEDKSLSFDKDMESFVLHSKRFVFYSITVSGFRQSWKYTQSIDKVLRRQLIFKKELQSFAENFLESSVPPRWNTVGFVRVGIHVRRGDIVSPWAFNYGYTVPNVTYFQNAMKYFTNTYDKVQFIVASDDYNWTKEYIVSEKIWSPSSVNVTHSFNHSSGQDMAILAMCDHVIMSTGTFGWWAAWLAKGTVIYYKDWPREKSTLRTRFTRADFFPPTWIPMGD